MVEWIIVTLYLGSILYVHFRGKMCLKFWHQMFDHSAVVTPVDCFMYAFSGMLQTPCVPAEHFPSLEKLQATWPQIRDEGLALVSLRKIRAAEKNDDAGFNSFFKNDQKRFYLKQYEAHHPSAERLCPQTVALLRGLPSVKAAVFAKLPPGSKLGPYRDPFADPLHYHLGLATPNNDRCFIEVDGQRHSWYDDQNMVSDKTYPHRTENASDKDRLALFCGIERPMRFGWAQRINKRLGRKVMTAANSPNDEDDQADGINKLFRYVQMMGQYRRRSKAWSRKVYYAVRFGLIIGVAALIVWI